jgi:hypothetical protein
MTDALFNVVAFAAPRVLSAAGLPQTMAASERRFGSRL